MSEDKTTKEENTTEKSKVEKAPKNFPKDVKIDKDADIEEESFDNKTETEKKLGLEELPEDIKKKMEKKQTEIDKKNKGKKFKKKKKKEKKQITSGKAFIKATYNNTIVSLTDMQGNLISWASAGVAGFKGPKKSTPYAAQIICRLAVGKAREEYGLEEVAVSVKGVGSGRESAIRALNNNGLIITSIKDVTQIPHNGCRQRKPRRV